MQIVKEARSSCERCGAADSRTLDFHHRDPATKVDHISLIAKQHSTSRLLEELAKCDVLCSNCHRIVEHENRVGAKVERPWENKPPRFVFTGIPHTVKKQLFSKIRTAGGVFSSEDPDIIAYTALLLKSNTITVDDCLVWNGPYIDTRPFTTIPGMLKSTSVRHLLLGIEERHIHLSCGTYGCVNRDHFTLKNKRKEWEDLVKVPETKIAAQQEEVSMKEKRDALEKRFMQFVRVVGTHHEWTGGRIRGFPQFNMLGKPIAAKRVAIALLTGLLPKGAVETCNFKHCVNPDHLRAKNK